MNEVEVDGVKIGPTEIVTFGTMISALLVLVFHQDWGLAAHIQTLAAQALVVLPVALGILRGFKHHGNVNVAIAKIAAPATVVVPTTVSYGGGSTYTFTPASPTEPDPNLGADVEAVDVNTVPEDIAP